MAGKLIVSIAFTCRSLARCYLQDGGTEHNVKPDGGGVDKTLKEKAKPAAEQAATSA